MYQVTIPIDPRAKPTDAEPTPEQADVISQTIAALNAAVPQNVHVEETEAEIIATANTKYKCGELVTLNFMPCESGVCEVMFVSGETPTELTVPDTVCWAGDFDSTALKPNATYRLRVEDGALGEAVIWTANKE